MTEDEKRNETEADAKHPAAEKGSTPGTNVRPAGPKKMDMPPRRWTKTDEEIDESFPASDPPGNY